MKKSEVITQIRKETPISIKVFRVALAFFFLSFLVQLVVSSRFSVKNGELQSLYAQKAALEQDLISLEYEDSLLSSLSRVENEALAAGYVPFEAPLQVISPLMFASLQQN